MQSRRAELRLGFETLKLPNEESMGLVGTSYLVEIGRGFMFGPAAYGAITGQRGGLFTVGAELAWRSRIAGPLEFEAGYYVGGGGGGAAPVGGGLMLRPHADLLWNFGRFKAGVSASQVRFANGNIDSHQLGLVLSADTDFSFITPREDGTLAPATGASGMGFDRMRAVVGTYLPPSGTLRVSGATMGPRLAYVGARLERFFSRSDRGPDRAGMAPYWGVETSGAAGGGVAGYAEYLATLGAEASPWGSGSAVGARVALGMGGGGDVSVGGGLLLKAAAYANVRVARHASLSLEGGYAKAPDGAFKAPFAALGLNWELDGIGDPGAGASATHPVRVEWVGGVGAYRAARSDRTTRSLQNVVLKGNRFVDENWYLTAQVHSAYSGGAGGYTVGLFGAGYETDSWKRWRLSGEMLVGAAGGGGVQTGGGALVQPMGYLSYAVTRSATARVGLGRIRSTGGNLSSGVAEILLVVPFGVSAHP